MKQNFLLFLFHCPQIRKVQVMGLPGGPVAMTPGDHCSRHPSVLASGRRGLPSVVVHGLLTAVASLPWLPCRGFPAVASLPWHTDLGSCGARAMLLHSIWGLPSSGTEPMSPAMAGRLLSTSPPGKSNFCSWSLFLGGGGEV